MEGKRRTNELVRACYSYLTAKGEVSEENITALTRLTWYSEKVDTYRNPSLSKIFNTNYEKKANSDIAEDIANKLNTPFTTVNNLIDDWTGFSAPYSTFRNTSTIWISENQNQIRKIMKLVHSNPNRMNYEQVTNLIEALPSIPGAGKANINHLAPESVITPLAFALSEDKKYPIINKRDNVKSMLSSLGMTNGSLKEQFSALYDLIDADNGIEDAATLDSLNSSFSPLMPKNDKPKQARIASKKPVKSELGRELPIKDEADVTVISNSGTLEAKQIHNTQTNLLIDFFKEYDVLEGDIQTCRYDALVRQYYENGEDLLIEVKSSNEVADFRMAIGQLYDYGRQLEDEFYPAVFIPSKPSEYLKDLAIYAKVMILWSDGNKIFCFDFEEENNSIYELWK